MERIQETEQVKEGAEGLWFAIQTAVTAHATDLDKGGKLYILHPLRVMMNMDTDEEKIVAVLHDVPEDTGIQMDFIRKHFSKRVADAVDAISRKKGESYFDYIYRVRANALATKVKLADLADNMSPERMGNLPPHERTLSKRYQKALEILT